VFKILLQTQGFKERLKPGSPVLPVDSKSNSLRCEEVTILTS